MLKRPAVWKQCQDECQDECQNGCRDVCQNDVKMETKMEQNRTQNGPKMVLLGFEWRFVTIYRIRQDGRVPGEPR